MWQNLKEEKEEEVHRESPIPKNFKYPERCSVYWNVKEQKHEWRQYIGGGHTCVPEKITKI